MTIGLPIKYAFKAFKEQVSENGKNRLVFRQCVKSNQKIQH